VVSKVVETIKNTSKVLKIKFTLSEKVYWDGKGIWAKWFFSMVGNNEKIIKECLKIQEKEDTGQVELEF